MQIHLLHPRIHLIIHTQMSNNLPHILFIRQSLQNLRKPIQLSIIRILIPRQYWQRILRLKHKRYRRIVNYYHILHRPPQSSQILHKRITIKCTMLSKQLIRTHSLLIQPIHQWLRIFRQRCSINHYLIILTHPPQKLIHTRTHQYKYRTQCTLYLHLQYQMRILYLFKTRMN